MKFGWIITSVIHGTVVLAALFSFGSVTPLDFDDVAPVEVEIITIAPVEQVGKKKTEDLTTKQAKVQPIKKPVEKLAAKPVPKPLPKPKKPKPPKADAPKPTPKVEKPKPIEKIENLIHLLPEPSAEPAPEKPLTRIASAPKPMKRPPVPQKKPVPEKKPEPVPLPLDEGKISALLDKLESETPDDIDLEFGDIETGTLDSDFVDDDIEVASLSQFEFNAVKARMTQCWSIPAGAQDAGSVVVKVGFKLNQFAEVIGQPIVLNSSPHPSFRVMADAAVRAIIDCAPYDMLPPEKYDVWSEFSMEFDPRSMFNG